MLKSLFLNKSRVQKGQSLLFVIVAMTIALTIGLTLTNRSLSSLRRTSNSDTSARVFSAAEGGIEWFLRQPVAVLDALADGDNASGSECPSGTSGDPDDSSACVITYEPQANDKIKASAQIKVSPFSLNHIENGNSNYWFTLNTGVVKEVSLTDYKTGVPYSGTLHICWKSLDNVQSSALYYLTYNEDGVQEKRLVSPLSVHAGTVFNMSADTNAGTGRGEYDSCYDHLVDSDAPMSGIRIKSMYAPSKVAVYPDTVNFPTQGFQIKSIGQLDDLNEQIKAVREIGVYKSLPYAPASFDYAIYSQDAIN